MKKQVLASLLAALLCGCAWNRVQTGETTRENRAVELAKTELARLDLKMGVGEMTITGGSPKLLEAEFLYNVPAWTPSMQTNATSFRTDIKIEQPGSASGANNAENKWDLRVNNDTPLDIVARLGVGETHMDLGTVRLRSLRVDMGVGSLQLDLKGKLKNDCDVEIHGGVGEAVVLLPKTAGISAAATGGIGEITAEGLERREGRWFNPARDPAAPTIHIQIAGGVGNIRLVAE
jgi:hypothetical protein